MKLQWVHQYVGANAEIVRPKNHSEEDSSDEIVIHGGEDDLGVIEVASTAPRKRWRANRILISIVRFRLVEAPVSSSVSCGSGIHASRTGERAKGSLCGLNIGGRGEVERGEARSED